MARVLGAVGRTLVTVGLLLLLFVAYQLWGTGIYEARAQDNLREQLQQQARSTTTTTTTTPTSTTTADNPTVSTTTTLAPSPAPPEGDAVGTIRIPKLGVDKAVIEGVNVDDLRQGPGHYPTTQLPGHEGNSAIAGHRTTYGAPFGDLDQLENGDAIFFQYPHGDPFVYKVTEKRVVDPSEISVLDPLPDPNRPGHDLATLTLTTCNPKYSAAERLIIRAELSLPTGSTPLPPTKTAEGKHATSIGGLSGDSSSRVPTIIWGSITLLIGLLWWLLFHRHPRWTTWFVGVVPFLAVLFVTYVYLERLLPSNY
jgi:sortase A